MSHFPETELILTADNRVYHINLKAEDIADDVIVVGDQHRVTEISKHFSKIEFKTAHREFVTHTGIYNGKRITVLSTGIGTDNIDIVLNELDALVNIDLKTRTIHKTIKSLNILRIGTAGSLQADIPVDSFVASTHGLGLDNLLNFYRLEHNEEEKQLLHSFITKIQSHGQMCNPYICSASASLLKHFVDGFFRGITVTCPGFYGPQGRILRLGLKNPELIDNLTGFSFGRHRIANFEMETSGIYGMGKLLGHNCISLNAIVANRIEKKFSKDSYTLVDQLIQKTLEIISTL